jgi:hypothetical protein
LDTQLCTWICHTVGMTYSRLGSGLYFIVAQVLSDIHFVHLLRRQEAVGVAPVHPRGQEQIEELRVDVPRAITRLYGELPRELRAQALCTCTAA